MKFSKIRFKDGVVVIDFTRPNGEDVEQCQLRCGDEPEKPLSEGLADLVGYVLKLCKLPKTAADSLEVVSLAIDQKQGGPRGFTISAVRTVDAGVYAVSTPRVQEAGEALSEGPRVATSEMVQRIDFLCKAAAAYVEGARTQTELFEEEEATGT